MPLSPFMAAINQICEEKNLSKETVLETVEAALAAAYRKDYGKPHQIIRAKIDPETDDIKMSRVFEVVKDVEDEENQISLKEAKKKNKKIKEGDEYEIPLPTQTEFGRIAAQTAKQVVTQQLREAERDVLYKEFKEKEGKVINGVVQQLEGNNVVINLGKINGILLAKDQVPSERYFIGQRLKIYIEAVEESAKGPRILVSRAHPGLIAGLFETEVPEVASGTVQIRGVAREPGARSKVAVFTQQEGLDPVGSCVGQRGTRVQSVIAEIGEEKIDIILYDEDLKKFIANALSPAKISKITLEKKVAKGKVYAPEDQLSLAIGKNGQNVRLAGKLTGHELDIIAVKVSTESRDSDQSVGKKAKTAKGEKKMKKEKKEA